MSTVVPVWAALNLSLIRKQNLSVDAADVFFVRFIRMKTSEKQGLSLFRTQTSLPVHFTPLRYAHHPGRPVRLSD